MSQGKEVSPAWLRSLRSQLHCHSFSFPPEPGLALACCSAALQGGKLSNWFGDLVVTLPCGPPWHPDAAGKELSCPFSAWPGVTLLLPVCFLKEVISLPGPPLSHLWMGIITVPLADLEGVKMYPNVLFLFLIHQVG